MIGVYLVTLVLLWVVHYYLSNKKWFVLPSPGLCLPVVGHSYKMTKFGADPVGSMWAWYRKYQKEGMMWIRSFNLNMMLVGDFDTLKHLYQHPDMQLRFVLDPMREERMIYTPRDIPGVILSNEEAWVEQRRFTLRTLRDFGFGKTGMEGMINEEVAMFIEEIKKTEGEPFDFTSKFNLPILNALWRITAGQRFEYNDPKLLSIVERITLFFQRLGRPSFIFIIAFPWITKLYPQFLERDKDLEVTHEVLNMMWSTIKEHEETIDPNEPRDFTDKVLIEIGKTTDTTSSFYGDVGREHLANTLLDLFLAGSETTSTTLTWAVMLMTRYPHIQTKVQEELDNIVGKSRTPSIDDKSNLPYTEAVLMEIQRFANILPLGVNHCSKKDITINGITIPANTLVQPLMTELLKGSYWGDGSIFRPERFLDDAGKSLKDEHLIPFSIGKRQCLGETLAKTELFLFFCGLLHEFRLYPEVEGELPSEDYIPGATILPKPFKVRLHTRI